mgnify:FL=1
MALSFLTLPPPTFQLIMANHFLKQVSPRVTQNPISGLWFSDELNGDYDSPYPQYHKISNFAISS